MLKSCISVRLMNACSLSLSSCPIVHNIPSGRSKLRIAVMAYYRLFAGKCGGGMGNPFGGSSFRSSLSIAFKSSCNIPKKLSYDIAITSSKCSSGNELDINVLWRV